jgi:hypothetical protein
MRVLSTLVLSLFFAASSFCQCGPDSTLINLFIAVDPWGEENYWELVPAGDSCGYGTLLSGANEMVGCAGTPPEVDGGYPDNTVVEVPSFCLPTGQSFDLIFVDSYGDGGPVFEFYENGAFAHTYTGSGYGNTWTFEVGNSGLPSYDSPCGALEIVVDGLPVLIDNTTCVAQNAEPRPPGIYCGLPGAWCEGNITKTAWARFSAQAGVTYEITSCNGGPGFDTQLALYKVSDCLGWSGFELIAANDDMAGGCSTANGYSSLLYANCLEDGATYYIQLDGWEGDNGATEISVRTVTVTNQLESVFNDIRCPIEKGQTPESSIYPYFTGGSSNFSCEWTGPNGFSSSEKNIINLGPGEYFVTATDACGNVFTSSYTVTQPDLWIVSTVESGPTCEATADGAINLSVNGATSPYSYAWIGPDGFESSQPDLNNLAAGNYQVTITDDNACETSAFVILEPLNSFSFDLGADTTLCLNEELMVVGPGGLLYQWQDMSNNQFFNIVASTWGIGQHAVVLTATTPEGCSFSDALNFTVADCNAIPEVNQSMLFNVFPNPAQGEFAVTWDGSRNSGKLQLTDMTGKVVAEQVFRQANQVLFKPKVAPGVYIIQVVCQGNLTSSSRIIIE